MFHACDYQTRWAASWDDVDEIERPSHFHQKTVFTIFFNGTGEYKIAILPKGEKMTSLSFIKSVMHPLAEICYPQGRGTQKGESPRILTMRPFTTVRGFKRVW
jgi:hypothetical protein